MSSKEIRRCKLWQHSLLLGAHGCWVLHPSSTFAKIQPSKMNNWMINISDIKCRLALTYFLSHSCCLPRPMCPLPLSQWGRSSTNHPTHQNPCFLWWHPQISSSRKKAINVNLEVKVIFSKGFICLLSAHLFVRVIDHNQVRFTILTVLSALWPVLFNTGGCGVRNEVAGGVVTNPPGGAGATRCLWEK